MEQTTRERRHERTRQAILEAARKIIASEGPEALSMRALAQRIDYSPAGLYEYFDNKDEIIGAVCEQGHRLLAQYMQRADASLPPDEYLLELGLAYLDFAQRNPDFFMLMFVNPATSVEPGVGPAEVMAKMTSEASSFSLLLQAIARGVQEGVFHTGPGYGVLEMGFTAWGMVHGMAMLRIGHLRHFPGDFTPIERDALRRIGAGLKAKLD